MATMTADKTFEGRTAAEWREMANQSRRTSAESWERSDTDGFLSQWASDAVARQYETKAKLAENDGYWDFFALFDLEGNRVYAQQVEGQYGTSWRIFDPETKQTIRWFNESKAQNPETARKNNEKKGIRFGSVRAKAVVYGSGNLTVHYGMAPVDKYLIDAEVVDNGMGASKLGAGSPE